MTTIELQNSIIRKILDIKDDQLLDYLNALLSNKKETYNLSDLEKSIIEESYSEYKMGRTTSNNEIISKTEKWLKE
jgi:hypothetical protein